MNTITTLLAWLAPYLSLFPAFTLAALFIPSWPVALLVVIAYYFVSTKWLPTVTAAFNMVMWPIGLVTTIILLPWWCALIYIVAFVLLMLYMNYFKKRKMVMSMSDANGVPATDNFDLVAKCVTFFYRAVLARPESAAWSEKQRLYAAALLDARMYWANGDIGPQDLELSVLCAYSGECNVFFQRVKYRSILETYSFEDTLVGLVLQLECLLFRLDTPNLSTEEIMDAVISNRSKIAQSVKSALSVPYIPPFFSDTTSQFFAIPDFIDTILAFKD